MNRCTAVTFAGKPGALLVRCILEAGHVEAGQPNHIEDREEKLGS